MAEVKKIKMEENIPCYDKDGNFLGFFSRSNAVVSFVFCQGKNGHWYILAAQRGKGTPDPEFVNAWNCPCGYLNWGETRQQAAQRELREETGLSLPLDVFNEETTRDNPAGDKRQNIITDYVCVITDKLVEDIKFSHKENEKDEVGDIKFVDISSLSNLTKYNWAFGHKDLIEKYARMYNI